MSTIAKRLQEAMSDRGVDQSAVAKSIGVTQGTISLILLGKTRRSKHLPDIAQYLGVSLSWLMGFSDVKHPEGPEQVLLGPQERSLIERFRMVGPIGQVAVKLVVDSLLLRWAVQTGSVTLVGPDHPAEAELADMFQTLLGEGLQDTTIDALALKLAQCLPAGLSQLRQDADGGPPPGSRANVAAAAFSIADDER